jgi:hypothetical protein
VTNPIEVSLPRGSTIADLKKILMTEYAFSPRRPLIYTSEDHVWDDADEITEFDSSSLFVIYDEEE